MTENAPPAFVNGNEAPIIFFEGAPFLGHANGIYAIAISAGVHVGVEKDKIQIDTRIVAHLRGSAEALKSLRDSIDKALLLGRETQGQPN